MDALMDCGTFAWKMPKIYELVVKKSEYSICEKVGAFKVRDQVLFIIIAFSLAGAYFLPRACIRISCERGGTVRFNPRQVNWGL